MVSQESILRPDGTTGGEGGIIAAGNSNDDYRCNATTAHHAYIDCGTSARGVADAVLHRDVGALQLLRHARAARAVPGQRAGLRAGRRVDAIRDLYRSRLSHSCRWRLSGRPLSRLPQGDPDRRHRDGNGTFRHGVPGAAAACARPDHSRQRLFQAQHLDVARHALPRARSAARWRLHHFLHRHQPRRIALGARRGNAGREDRLALGFCIRGRRHAVRPGAIRAEPAQAWQRRAAPRKVCTR